MKNEIQITRLQVLTDETFEAISKLTFQLVNDAPALTREYLEKVVKSDNTLIFVAKEEDVIIGTFSMVIYYIPTGIKASIEDVVVDSAMRGRGVGEALLRYAIKYAANAGISKLDLTSRPSRIAANSLYRKVGFELRDTNVYRIELDNN